MKNIFSSLVVTEEVTLPYISLGVTESVLTQSVPAEDDSISLPIDVPFPFGSRIESTIYVCYLENF